MITLPRDDKLLLMLWASVRVCPAAPVLPTFSEPARSTRVSLAPRLLPVFWSTWPSVRMKTECDRDDCSFMFVLAMARLSCPCCIICRTCSIELTYVSVTPSM